MFISSTGHRPPPPFAIPADQEAEQKAQENNQIPIHRAVQEGNQKYIEELLQNGIDINVTDSSNRTPLFFAIIHGHRSIVEFLINKKADVTICTIEQDTIIHAAAFYGHTEILKDLLQNPDCKKFIHAKNYEAKTPLHKATWGNPKPEIVQLLIDHGADPTIKSKCDYTPLHWAAKHGHVESVVILIRHGAKTNEVNSSGDRPFELAMRWGQDEMVHFFLGTKKRLPKLDGPLPKDLEAHYYQCLHQAKRENLIEELALTLEKMSRLFIRKKEYLTAAKFLNSALAVLQKHKPDPIFERYLFSQLEKIEIFFLEDKKIKTPLGRSGHIEKNRARLQEIRKNCKEAHENKKPAHEALVELTEEFKKVLRALIMSSQELLGPPPINGWACIAMGSMARGEMCPYSDIEFAFLIEDDCEDALEYFRTLSQFLELQVINLGETKLPLFFAEEEPSLTPSGFSMDSAGNTPLGVPGLYELIGTPAQLAQFQTIKWINRNIILANAMSTVCLVAGDQKLLADYCQKKAVTLEKNREKLGMQLLMGRHKRISTQSFSRKREK